MSSRMIAICGLFIVLFGVTTLYLIRNQAPKAKRPRPAPALTEFSGKLDIRRIDDLRVGSREIVLCGTAYARPASMIQLVTDVVKTEFQGKAVTCRPVGLGTPCDGNMAPKFGRKTVAQCATGDGSDLADSLIARKALCGVPAQAGDRYPTC